MKRKHPLDVRSSPKSPNVRSASARKLGKDGPSWTPTERLKRDRLMRQFTKATRKGVEVRSGNSEEYQANYAAIDWSKG